MKQAPKELLCIHYYYPPIRSGGVIRNFYFSKAFGKFFQHVHVVTTSNVNIMAQEEVEIPSHISIHIADTRDFRSYMNKNTHVAESKKKSLIVQFLLRLKKTLPFHFWLGEGGRKYIRTAYHQACEIIEKRAITHIYSSFMPYADHLVASKIKKKYPQIIWIADFRDLQVEPIYQNVLFPSMNLRIERRILQSADLLTTVSEGLAQALRKIHSRVISVPRGIEPTSLITTHNKSFTICYTGNLFQNYRDGAFFVRALASYIERNKLTNRELCFIYAGRDGMTWRKWFEESNILSHFNDRGFVSRNEAIEIQKHSNALLMLSSSSSEHQGVLTGKLFEYLEKPLPIINVIQGSYDQEFEDLFRELDAGKIIYTDQEEILVSHIDYLYCKFVEGKPWKPSAAGMAERGKWNWEARAKQILDAI